MNRNDFPQLEQPQEQQPSPFNPGVSTRRRFLATATAAAAVSSVPAYSQNRVKAVNGEARIAVIGVRGQGNGHIGRAIASHGKGGRLVAVCDADSNVLDERKAQAEEKGGGPIKAYADYRKLIEDPEIDAVVIATPNHLHATIAIAAAQAGKHVYVEKPVSHNIWEGRKLVEASEKCGVIIQHGMQRRSDVGWREIMEWIQDEPLGKMVCSRGLCYKTRKSIGKVDGPQKVPDHIDYDLWSGPREMLPLMRTQFHYDWHWQFAYGNGDIGNQGPHQLDVAHWGLGDPGHPAGVMSIGGRFGYEDDADTANTQIAFFDYQPVPLIFEVRGLPAAGLDWGRGMPAYKGGRVANILEFEGGWITEGRAYDSDGKSVKKFGVTDGAGHFENWVAALHGAEPDKNLTAEIGHVAAALAHMANDSFRLGEEVSQAEATERLSGDKLAQETFQRFQEHLAANGMEEATTKVVAGPHLGFDPAAEQFTGDYAADANALDRESYRKGYEVPETI